MRVLAASNRRARIWHGAGGIQPRYRRPMAVRYPWEYPVGGEDGSWGTDEYVQRSWLDGAGEPDITSPPSNYQKAAMRRRLLTTRNSKREVLEWKHTTIRNYTEEKDEQGSTPDQWWADIGDGTSITHPVAQDIDGNWRECPSPLTDEAVWIIKEDDWSQSGDIRVRHIQIAEDPCDICAKMTWDSNSDTLTDARVAIYRTCERIHIWKSAYIDNAGALQLGFIPNWTLRWITPPANPVADRRYQPAGWTDAVRNLATGSYLDGLLEGNYGKAEEAVVAGHDQMEPPHPIVGMRAGEYDSWDIGKLSNSKLASCLKYSAQVWARADSTFVDDGHTRIEAGRYFDLIVDAHYYGYKRYTITNGVSSVHSTGFAGAYGTCYAIY